jgi:hypothetical protein
MPPARFLSDAEIERLGAFAESIDRRDVARYFQLGGEDLAFVRQQRGAASGLRLDAGDLESLLAWALAGLAVAVWRFQWLPRSTTGAG